MQGVMQDTRLIFLTPLMQLMLRRMYLRILALPALPALIPKDLPREICDDPYDKLKPIRDLLTL